MRTTTTALPVGGIRRVAAAALAVTMLLASLVAGPQPYVDVVATTSGSVAAVVDDIVELGGRVTTVLDDFGIVTAQLPQDAVTTLSGLVDHVTLDRDLAPAGKPAADDDPPSTTAAVSVGATMLHANGFTGEGVGIAIVDTGVDPVGPIRDQMVAGANVVGAAQGDAYGHGTFLAGIITGDGGDTAGVAPGAHLVSVRVTADDGSTSLSSLLRGLATVRLGADDLGVRVVLLAFGVEPSDVAVPLSQALRVLWADGLTVVVPAGNAGPGAGTLTVPGADPYLLVVGASDDQGTGDVGDDTLLAMSGRGHAAERVGPDLLAPGTSLQSLRAPGSLIDRTHMDARVGANGFRDTGTSMAAAVAAGAAALLLDQDPSLGPDEVKGRMIDGATPLDADETAAGAGLLDIVQASASTATANAALPALDSPAWPVPADELSDSPAPSSWLGRNWAGRNWAGRNWAGRNWAGEDWAGRNWAGRNWAGEDWAGRNWAGRNWAADAWMATDWRS